MTKKNFKVIKNKNGQIFLNDTLYEHRLIFINDSIDKFLADEIIKSLLVLDMINTKPIQMHITSPGGRVDWGFAIIDVMKKIKSKVITIANGQVASMGTLIAIAGDERKCFSNTTFMFHDMFSGIIDYSAKMKARMQYTEKLYEKLEKHIYKYTKLTKKEVDLSRSEELWVFAENAIEKGLVDSIIKKKSKDTYERKYAKCIHKSFNIVYKKG